MNPAAFKQTNPPTRELDYFLKVPSKYRIVQLYPCTLRGGALADPERVGAVEGGRGGGCVWVALPSFADAGRALPSFANAGDSRAEGGGANVIPILAEACVTAWVGASGYSPTLLQQWFD